MIVSIYAKGCIPDKCLVEINPTNVSTCMHCNIMYIRTRVQMNVVVKQPYFMKLFKYRVFDKIFSLAQFKL